MTDPQTGAILVTFPVATEPGETHMQTVIPTYTNGGSGPVLSGATVINPDGTAQGTVQYTLPSLIDDLDKNQTVAPYVIATGQDNHPPPYYGGITLPNWK
jgi:hypothetical protein